MLIARCWCSRRRGERKTALQLFIPNSSVTTKLYKLEEITRKLQVKKKRSDVTISEYRLCPNIPLGILVPTTSLSGRVTTRKSQTPYSHYLLKITQLVAGKCGVYTSVWHHFKIYFFTTLSCFSGLLTSKAHQNMSFLCSSSHFYFFPVFTVQVKLLHDPVRSLP